MRLNNTALAGAYPLLLVILFCIYSLLLVTVRIRRKKVDKWIIYYNNYILKISKVNPYSIHIIYGIHGNILLKQLGNIHFLKKGNYIYLFVI